MLTIHRAGYADGQRLAFTLLRTDSITGGFPSDDDLKKYWEKVLRVTDDGFHVIRRAAGSLAVSLPADTKEQVAQEYGKSLKAAMRSGDLKIARN